MKSKLPELLETLKTCTENVNVTSYMTGTDCMPRPAEKVPGLPEFGDMVQVIDFVDRKEAEQYLSLIHINVFHNSFWHNLLLV